MKILSRNFVAPGHGIASKEPVATAGNHYLPASLSKFGRDKHFGQMPPLEIDGAAASK
ncbi:MAG TPA: hypothetical protein VMP01_24525 [Pirellulaceae bacterium]|nr:hypothetical protein [Pirellulaceae bacterium]